MVQVDAEGVCVKLISLIDGVDSSLDVILVLLKGHTCLLSLWIPNEYYSINLASYPFSRALRLHLDD